MDMEKSTDALRDLFCSFRSMSKKLLSVTNTLAKLVRISPPELAIKIVLLQEGGIVGLELLHVRHGVGLGVEVELVELLHPLLGLRIL